jgi:hypothetical protein
MVMKKIIMLFSITFLGISIVFSQNYFRSGIFLHHSTGGYIWGPNPDGTSTKTIPGEMQRYNMEHNYTGDKAVSMDEEWWSPGDNEWSTQHEFFEGNTTFTDINYYLSNNKILVVKSCFPSSAIENWGQPSDTTDPTYKTVYNYKWHWRHIVKVMKDHPQNFFSIWTNAPLEINSTNASQASLSKKFCHWAKDTLAAGLDPVFGAFPPNVYVFDYFGKMSDEQGYELPQFVTGVGDSHPNGAGTDFAAPQFVDEIFSAAIAYESLYNSIPSNKRPPLVACFPNPFRSQVNFVITPERSGQLIFSVYNSIGTEITRVEKSVNPGKEIIQEFDLSRFPAGVYFYQVSDGINACTGKMIRK